MSAKKSENNLMERFIDQDTLKSLGAVPTPGEIVELMLRLAGVRRWKGLEILEPGAGLCEFLTRIQARHPENHFTAVELNPEIFKIASSLHKNIKTVMADFLLWRPDREFDLIIGNPPYGIIGDQSHYPIHALKEKRKTYRARFQTWRGKYNIYGAFIEKSVTLLKDGGKLVFIVPATFMVLDDFKLLRKFLAESGRSKIYYLGPGVFEKRQVSTAVIVFEKGRTGLELFDATDREVIKLCLATNPYEGSIIRFESAKTRNFEQGKIPLGEIFEIHFAARSPEVRNHPLTSADPGPGLAPVLTGRNLHAGLIDFEKCYSRLYFPKNRVTQLREFYGFPHLVVGHTKGGRVVAALDERGCPWREELHLVPKCKVALRPLADYLNSQPVQRYMKSLYKEITPHLTITQLKLVPIPAP
jgi:adenine-specific DNA-methyltransferase